MHTDVAVTSKQHLSIRSVVTSTVLLHSGTEGTRHAHGSRSKLITAHRKVTVPAKHGFLSCGYSQIDNLAMSFGRLHSSIQYICLASQLQITLCNMPCQSHILSLLAILPVHPARQPIPCHSKKLCHCTEIMPGNGQTCQDQKCACQYCER